MKFKKLVLVLNCGSSSLKFSIQNIDNNTEYLSGIVECLYLRQSRIKWYINNNCYQKIIGDKVTHFDAFKFIKKEILDCEKNIFNYIIGIGHRVVHGGVELKRSTIIDISVIKEIKRAIIFSPIHNPVNIMSIELSLKMFPQLSKKNVAVFDTSFYGKLPKEAYLYAIPYYLYTKYGIRRYGAHGISHNYIMTVTSGILKKSIQQLNIISCHLGNGASISAIYNGVCIDTSMGLSPLEGLVMGSRSGDIDPSIIFFLHETLKMSMKDINHILISKSGLLGLSGISSDFRNVEAQFDVNIQAQQAIQVFCYRIKKYISSYFSLMKGRLDAIIFTGGIGEHSSLVRQLSLDSISLFGQITIDNSKNISLINKNYNFINDRNSIPILVIPTNEELFIAQEVIKCINNN
ncbi:MAG: acetate kinase [Buchnera aphidicola (Eriosoma harunire)]